MVWYKNKEISMEEVEKLPEGDYILVNKDFKLVGHSVLPKSELISAVEETNIPNDKLEIQGFEWNFTNKIDYSKFTALGGN